MKKTLLYLLILVIFSACRSTPTSIASKQYDYFSLPTANMSEYAIDSNDVRFVQDDFTIMIKSLNDKKPGIYLVGYSACPWCQELVPVLNEALVKTDMKAFYIDVYSDNFTEELFEDLAKFDESLGEQKSDGGVPFLIVIDDDGTINTHLGTVKGHNAHKSKMTAEQRNTLLKILIDLTS